MVITPSINLRESLKSYLCLSSNIVSSLGKNMPENSSLVTIAPVVQAEFLFTCSQGSWPAKEGFAYSQPSLLGLVYFLVSLYDDSHLSFCYYYKTFLMQGLSG